MIYFQYNTENSYTDLTTSLGKEHGTEDHDTREKPGKVNPGFCVYSDVVNQISLHSISILLTSLQRRMVSLELEAL